MIEGVGGLTIKPAKLPLPGETSSIPRSVLDYELYPNEIGSDPAIRDCTNFVANKQIQQTTAMNSGSSVADLDRDNRQSMKSALQPQDNQVKATRDHLLTYLGFDPVQSVRLTDALEEDFIIAPIVMTETENN